MILVCDQGRSQPYFLSSPSQVEVLEVDWFFRSYILTLINAEKKGDYPGRAIDFFVRATRLLDWYFKVFQSGGQLNKKQNQTKKLEPKQRGDKYNGLLNIMRAETAWDPLKVPNFVNVYDWS